MTETLQLTEKSFDTGEVTLNYVDSATAGTPMILLHGGLRWWHDWEPVIPAFTAQYHVYAIDLRGHGKSGREGDHYRLTDFARDIQTFLHRQAGQPAILVGQSLGALVSLVTAAQAPESVRAIALLDPPLSIYDPAVRVQDEHLKEYTDWFVFVREMLRSVQSFDELVAKLAAMHPDGEDVHVRSMAESIYGLDPTMIDMTLDNRLFEGIDLAQTLGQITCPALIVQADWDHGGLMRDADADLVRAHLPGAKIVKIPNTSHLLLQEHPDQMASEVQSFLNPV